MFFSLASYIFSNYALCVEQCSKTLYYFILLFLQKIFTSSQNYDLLTAQK